MGIQRKDQVQVKPKNWLGSLEIQALFHTICLCSIFKRSRSSISHQPTREVEQEEGTQSTRAPSGIQGNSPNRQVKCTPTAVGTSMITQPESVIQIRPPTQAERRPVRESRVPIGINVAQEKEVNGSNPYFWGLLRAGTISYSFLYHPLIPAINL